MTLQDGTVLSGRYKIQRLLHTGSRSTIYLAQSMVQSVDCLIKEYPLGDSTSQQHFYQKSEKLLGLQHPLVAHALDYFIVPDQGMYLVFDYFGGDSLQDLINTKGAQSPARAEDWLNQILSSVNALHSQKPPIVHGDIEPSNIRLDSGGNAVLVGIGLFEPGHVDPAVLSGLTSPDPRIDVYAIGETVFALLQGKKPVSYSERSSGADLPNLASLNPRIPRHLSDWVARCMALDPSQRFRNASEARIALQQPASSAVPPTQKPPFVQAAQSVPSQPPGQPIPPPISQPHPMGQSPYSTRQQPVSQPYASGQPLTTEQQPISQPHTPGQPYISRPAPYPISSPISQPAPSQPKPKQNKGCLIAGGVGGAVLIFLLLVFLILRSINRAGTNPTVTPAAPTPIAATEFSALPTVSGGIVLLPGFEGTPDPNSSFSYLHDLCENADQEILTPGTYTFNCETSPNQPVVIDFGWCATTQAVLDENWSSMEYRLKIGSMIVNLDRVAYLSDYQGQQGYCRAYRTYATNFPSGLTNINVFQNVSAPINDGTSDYKSGLYTQEFQLTVR